MSALTRARRGNWITFNDKYGKVVTGVVLELRSDYALVGVQPASCSFVNNGRRMTYNNQVWAVPYVSVVSTSTIQGGVSVRHNTGVGS